MRSTASLQISIAQNIDQIKEEMSTSKYLLNTMLRLCNRKVIEFHCGQAKEVCTLRNNGKGTKKRKRTEKIIQALYIFNIS